MSQSKAAVSVTLRFNLSFEAVFLPQDRQAFDEKLESDLLTFFQIAKSRLQVLGVNGTSGNAKLLAEIAVLQPSSSHHRTDYTPFELADHLSVSIRDKTIYTMPGISTWFTTNLDISFVPVVTILRPIDGGYGEWISQSFCTGTNATELAGEEKTFRRYCDNPAPAFGGAPCSGPAIKVEQCHTRDIPVDGGYGPWSLFGPCSKSCGVGKHVRTRACDSPAAQSGGASCLKYGMAEEERMCNTQKCPEAPTGMSDWTGFSGNETASMIIMHNDGCAPFACAPSGLTITGITSTSAMVEWSSLPTATSGYVLGLLPREGWNGQSAEEEIIQVVSRKYKQS